MTNFQLFLIYTALMYGILLFMTAWTQTRFTLWMAAIPPVAAAAGTALQQLISAALPDLLWRSRGSARKTPGLSKAHALMKQERWDEALAELETQWISFPGNGEVLRLYERLYLDGLHAPIAMVKFFMAALERLSGDDKAYAYLRLAELNSDTLGNKAEAAIWCRRLMLEHPGFHPSTVRGLMESLKAEK